MIKKENDGLLRQMNFLDEPFRTVFYVVAEDFADRIDKAILILLMFAIDLLFPCVLVSRGLRNCFKNI